MRGAKGSGRQAGWWLAAAMVTVAFTLPASASAEGPCDMAEGRLAPTTQDFYMNPSPALDGFVIFVDFPNAPTTDPDPSDELATIAESTNRYFRLVSRGRHGLPLRGTSTYLRMPEPSSAYGITESSFPYEGANKLFADAVAAADAAHDLNGVETVLILTSLWRQAGALAYEPVPADGDLLRRAYISHDGAFVDGAEPIFLVPLIMHELGHHFGLPDLYVVGRPAPDDQRTMGVFDIMAGGIRDYYDPRPAEIPRFSSYSLYMMGELRPRERICLSQGGRRVLLTPLYRGDGKKMLFIKTSPTTGFTVEVRHRSERYLCGAFGVVVARLRSNAPYDRDPQAMHLVRSRRGDRGECLEAKAPFTEPGLMVNNRRLGVRIRLIARRGENYLIGARVESP